MAKSSLREYLTITPRARPGLADEDRLHRLLSELAAHDLKAAYPPFGPLMGPKLDLWVATERVCDSVSIRSEVGSWRVTYRTGAPL